MLLAVTLWVLYGSPIHSRSEVTRSRGADCSRHGRAARGCRPDRSHRSFAAGPCAPTWGTGQGTGPARSRGDAPTSRRASDQSGSSSVNAAEQRAKETQAEAEARTDQPQLARTRDAGSPPDSPAAGGGKGFDGFASSDAMQCRSLRGHIQVFPCRRLHLPALSGRTAAYLRVIGEAQPPRGGEEPLAGSTPSFAGLRVRT